MPENGWLNNEALIACRSCPRMRAQFRRLRKSHPDYWNAPVPPNGRAGSPLLIVGLAPGMHGANKTGRAFTGDASGELLFGVLDRLGLTRKVEITNAVKCLPPANLPKAGEVQRCQRWLIPELEDRRSILVLGGVAHRAVIRAFGLRQADWPFGHAAIHELPTTTLVASYHCSRYNTQTGRLTEPMFHSVVESAAHHAGLLS